MDRNKILELVREAELARQFALEVPFVVDRLQRFAALIEREVCGDAEPVAWMSPKKERLEFSRADTVYGSHTIPLYTHPTPAVVRQLVEALEDLLGEAEDGIATCPLTRIKARQALEAVRRT